MMGMSLNLIEAISFAHARPLPQALTLRYQVYCEEFDYLPASDYPLKQESDADDAGAAHFHFFEPPAMGGIGPGAADWGACASGTLAGYVRLVRPDAHGLLPVQRRCHLRLERSSLPDPATCAEVSRLIIAPAFRRQRHHGPARLQAAHNGAAGGGTQALATDILLQLFRQMVNYSRAHGIRYWFAAMERPLARSLAQMGFPFQAAGPEGEFFGRITPYLADLHELQHRVAVRQPRLAQWLLPPEAAGGHATAHAAQGAAWARRPPPPQAWHADA